MAQGWHWECPWEWHGNAGSSGTPSPRLPPDGPGSVRRAGSLREGPGALPRCRRPVRPRGSRGPLVPSAGPCPAERGWSPWIGSSPLCEIPAGAWESSGGAGLGCSCSPVGERSDRILGWFGWKGPSIPSHSLGREPSTTPGCSLDTSRDGTFLGTPFLCLTTLTGQDFLPLIHPNPPIRILRLSMDLLEQGRPSSTLLQLRRAQISPLTSLPAAGPVCHRCQGMVPALVSPCCPHLPSWGPSAAPQFFSPRFPALLRSCSTVSIHERPLSSRFCCCSQGKAGRRTWRWMFLPVRGFLGFPAQLLPNFSSLLLARKRGIGTKLLWSFSLGLYLLK